MDLGSDGARDLDRNEAGELDQDAGDLELPGPEPVMDQDPETFQVMSAGESGPLPPDVSRELEQIASALGTALDDPEGLIATRFGRRIVVAPMDSPGEAVDVADVDMPRHLVLTFGGDDPTPQGALLAQVLFQRREMAHGYVHAPDVKGPTFSLLQRVLPALHGTGAVEIEEIGTFALGHRPAEIAAAVQGLEESEDDEEDRTLTDEDPDVHQA